MAAGEPRPGVDRILDFEETLRALQQWVGREVLASVGSRPQFDQGIPLGAMMTAHGRLDSVVRGERFLEDDGERFDAFIVDPATGDERAQVTLYSASFRHGIWPRDWNGVISAHFEGGIMMVFTKTEKHDPVGHRA